MGESRVDCPICGRKPGTPHTGKCYTREVRRKVDARLYLKVGMKAWDRMVGLANAHVALDRKGKPR